MKNNVIEFSDKSREVPAFGVEVQNRNLLSLSLYLTEELRDDVRAWALHWECSFSEACWRILSVGLVNLPRKSKRTRRARLD